MTWARPGTGHIVDEDTGSLLYVIGLDEDGNAVPGTEPAYLYTVGSESQGRADDYRTEILTADIDTAVEYMYMLSLQDSDSW